MSFIITASDGASARWSTEALTAAAADLDPTGEVELVQRQEQVFDLVVEITPSDSPGFAVRRNSDGKSLSTDGTLPQSLRVAVWARALLPEDFGADLWIVDQGFNERAVVAAGADLDAVAAAWKPITD